MQHAAATPAAAVPQQLTAPLAAAADNVLPSTADTTATADASATAAVQRCHVSNAVENGQSRAGSKSTGAGAPDSPCHAVPVDAMHASTAGAVCDGSVRGKAAAAGTDAAGSHRQTASCATPPHWLMCHLTKVLPFSSLAHS